MKVCFTLYLSIVFSWSIFGQNTESFRRIDHAQTSISKNNGPTFTNISKLNSGDIHKLSVELTELIKLDYSYLQNIIGVDPSSIDPRQIQIFSHQPGKLSQRISDQSMDDLVEMAIMVIGEDDGIFHPEDAILLYAPGPHDEVRYEYNVYDDLNYLYLKFNDEIGKRIESVSPSSDVAYISDSYDFSQHHERNDRNLLGDFISTPGSGQRWFGEIFSNERMQEFSESFDLSGLLTDEPIVINAAFAGRSSSLSEVELHIDDQRFKKSIGTVSTGNIERRYARVVEFSEEVTLTDDSPKITIEYPRTSATSEGWLDYIRISGRKNAVYNGRPLILEDKLGLDHDVAGYEVSTQSSNQLSVWDITQFDNITSHTFTTNPRGIRFSYVSDTLRRFLVFDANQINDQPEYIGPVSNQNLHGLDEAEVIIIYHPDFEDAALRLRDHRAMHSGFDVKAIDVNLIYNEFSSGKHDPTAIRNFCKMIYDRDPMFNYLIILGDGSYDYRGITSGQAAESFVPTYETIESLDPIRAFPSDDYYALLSDFEGENLRGALDIAVGRLPARTADEANAMVDKIIHYDTSERTLGDWRVRNVFLADDEDSNIHVNDADDIAEDTKEKFPAFNQEKIYFDAFVQESTPGGARYPGANAKLNREILSGASVVNYLGHGGPKGWSQERVLKIEDINSWQNPDKMPLIITATCSFTGFDDPQVLSAGEQSILRANGGAIALFSTVRSVYANQNERLTRAVFDTIFTKVNKKYMPIGEVLRRAKNSNQADTININARKFAVFGDPSMTLSLPEFDVATTTVNGHSSAELDTISALQRVIISGQIEEDGELLTDFNGTVFPTIFDKVQQGRTLKNDSGSRVKSFDVQNNIIFKGTATVINGRFEFEFVVPLDIDFDLGRARVSYYAQSDDQRDAMGHFDNIIIGGIDDDAANDDLGPEIQLYMNNEAFLSGGITSESPTVLAILSDDIGINVSGTSIGHDITGLLDDNTQNTFVLNEFYTAERDDFTKGVLRFPLQNLETGRHSFTLKAFDVANNPGEARIEFVVLEDGETTIDKLFNFPNPFDISTNFSFEHGLSNTDIQVIIEIYDMTGQLVKSINSDRFADGFRINDMSWDGTTDAGARLATGIYAYKVKLNSDALNISTESAFQKLVLLN